MVGMSAGAGTVSRLAKWTDPTHLGDSGLIDDGTTITLTLPTVANSTLQLDSLTAKSFVYTDASKRLATTVAPTNGQLLIGSTGNIPVAASLTAGANITITPGAGSVTIASTGGGSTQGKHTEWIPASAMTPALTNGPGVSQLESATNKNNVLVHDFDPTTQEFDHFTLAMPKSWDEGTVTFQVWWTPNTTTDTTSVVWGLQAVAKSDSDPWDVAFGTAQEITDAGLGVINDVHASAESSAITIAGTPAEGDLVEFRLYRDPADASDTLVVDARLIGIKLFYTMNADTDA